MIFSILTNFQHLKFTAHEDMRDLTDGEPRNRRTDTRTNYCMPTVHRAPRHNDCMCTCIVKSGSTVLFDVSGSSQEDVAIQGSCMCGPLDL